MHYTATIAEAHESEQNAHARTADNSANAPKAAMQPWRA